MDSNIYFAVNQERNQLTEQFSTIKQSLSQRVIHQICTSMYTIQPTVFSGKTVDLKTELANYQWTNVSDGIFTYVEKDEELGLELRVEILYWKSSYRTSVSIRNLISGDNDPNCTYFEQQGYHNLEYFTDSIVKYCCPDLYSKQFKQICTEMRDMQISDRVCAYLKRIELDLKVLAKLISPLQGLTVFCNADLESYSLLYRDDCYVIGKQANTQALIDLVHLYKDIDAKLLALSEKGISER